MAHFIGMNGSPFAMPDNIVVTDTIPEAVEALGNLLDLDEYQRYTLDATGIVYLGSQHGANYAEIIGCNCSDPTIHEE